MSGTGGNPLYGQRPQPTNIGASQRAAEAKQRQQAETAERRAQKENEAQAIREGLVDLSEYRYRYITRTVAGRSGKPQFVYLTEKVNGWWVSAVIPANAFYTTTSWQSRRTANATPRKPARSHCATGGTPPSAEAGSDALTAASRTGPTRIRTSVR